MLDIILWAIFIYVLVKFLLKVVSKSKYKFDEELVVEDNGTRTTYHVVHIKEPHGWYVEKEGGELMAFAETKAEAVQLGKEFARAHVKGQLLVHCEDGTFQEEYTYGYDPRDIEG